MKRARIGRRRAVGWLAASLATTGALPLHAIAEARSAKRVRMLRAADVQPRDYPTSAALAYMGERLHEWSDGRLALKVYAGGQLGDETDTLEITIFGGIDVNRVNLAPITSIEPLTQVLALPFLFRSISHMRATVDGPIGEEILATLEPHGLIGLAFYDSGARSFYNVKRPIRTLADMRGLKIRVQSSELAVAMVRALGANATPMGYGQVYESLVLGTIDGSENNWPSYFGARHFEAAPHYTLTEHTMAPEVVVMSRRRWLRLEAADREIVRRAAKASVPVMRALWEERERLAREQLRARGVEIVTEFERGAFETAMQPVYREWLRDARLARLVERIRAVRTA